MAKKKDAEGRRPAEVAVVLRLAVLSRFLVLSLIAFWRLLFQPYDTSASLNPSCLSSTFAPSSGQSTASQSVLWPRIGAAIEASVVWDGVYFVRIAECGYEYEQTYAFLPLLPAAMTVVARSVFAPLVPVVGYRAVLALSAYALNNLAFVLAAVYFHRLSCLILKDQEAALRASALFCFNPASIFYSSIYSESLYALFSLGGLYYLFSGANTASMVLLALSGSARSNGALNAGYFCFQALLQAYDAMFLKKKLNVAAQAISMGVISSIFIFMPFLAFQAYGYYNICLGGAYDELRPWCKATIPLIYGFIQSHYWGVGFLRYFEMKQLPNFLLASPALSIAISSVIHYSSSLRQTFKSLQVHGKSSLSTLMSFGTNRSSESVSPIKDMLSSSTREDQNLRWRKQQARQSAFQFLEDLPSADQPLPEAKNDCIVLLPFVLHLAFMIFTAFFIMHVQVSTRFLSASPPIYWFASFLMASSNYTLRRWSYLILVYFISYVLLGSLLFANFYPFT